MLSVRLMGDGKIQAVAQGHNCLLILNVHIPSKGSQSQRAVHCSRVQMQNAKLCRNRIRNRAFSCADRTINANIKPHAYILL
jgi:hypothetical protein